MSQCYITFGQVIDSYISRCISRWLRLYSDSSVSHFHSLGSSYKNSWDMPRIVGNCLCFLSTSYEVSLCLGAEMVEFILEAHTSHQCHEVPLPSNASPL